MQKGNVVGLYIAPTTDGDVIAQETVHLVSHHGIVGDRYYLPQQNLNIESQALRKEDITLISADELETFNTRFELAIALGDFRRNVVTRGIDLNQLVGKRFRLGGALCEGMELCEPCRKLARTVNPFVLPHLVHRAGIRAAIIESGNVVLGDNVKEIGKKKHAQ